MRSGQKLLFFSVLVAAALCFSWPSAALVTESAEWSTAVPLKIVFAAAPRSAGRVVGSQAIYTVNADGTDLRRVTQPDGFAYDWPVWGFGGTKIIYTARGLADTDDRDSIYMMDADGSNPQKLTANLWRNAQPKASLDGHSILFTSMWSEFPDTALYRLDLRTLQVDNLSARHQETGARDSDPRYSFDGSRIVFANSRSDSLADIPTQIQVMNADGGRRRWVTDDRYYNTDPSLSPDNQSVAIASYRGSGSPQPEGPKQRFEVKLDGWQLVVRDIDGPERVYTDGQACYLRVFERPCRPNEGPAWVPQWSPDGTSIGFLSVRSAGLSGIYAVDANGGNPRTIFESDGYAISWWDWTASGGRFNGLIEVGTSVAKSALLFGGRIGDDDKNKTRQVSLFASGSDHWGAVAINTRDLTVEFARWTPDRKHIVFTARTPVDRSLPLPYPAPPLGEVRHTHFTLGGLIPPDPPSTDVDVAEEQVYLMDPDGRNIRKVTTPWIEDYMDGIPDGEARGNTSPDISPDGRYVIFTNVSDSTFESFILRLDLDTGEVLNLTNVTSGAVPVADSRARFSPDGSTIAFSSLVGGLNQVLVMDRDGRNVRQVTDDDYQNIDPSWSPDGRSIVFSSYRGSEPLIEEVDLRDTVSRRRIRLQDWHLAKIDLATKISTILTTAGVSPALRPVWSPEGDSIAFISIGKQNGNLDVFVVPSTGGPAKQLAVTLRLSEEFIDWR